MRPDEVELIRRDYVANGGWETFLEYGDPRQDILIGLLRLRKISGAGEAWNPGISGVSRGVGSGGVCSVLRLSVPAWALCSGNNVQATRVQRMAGLHQVVGQEQVQALPGTRNVRWGECSAKHHYRLRE